MVKNDERILVVGVTIRYDNRDYFLKAQVKIGKYFPYLNHLKAKYSIDNRDFTRGLEQ
jgi:hypothetical protein